MKSIFSSWKREKEIERDVQIATWPPNSEIEQDRARWTPSKKDNDERTKKKIMICNVVPVVITMAISISRFVVAGLLVVIIIVYKVSELRNAYNIHIKHEVQSGNNSPECMDGMKYEEKNKTYNNNKMCRNFRWFFHFFSLFFAFFVIYVRYISRSFLI